MSKKSALITGVGGGIGRAIAVVFLDNGWDVFGIDVNAPEPPVKGLHFMKGDLADPVSIRGCVDEVLSKAGKIDALVNNAAVQVCKPVEDTELEDWDSVMAVNLRSVYLLIKYLRPSFSKGASIVNVSSVHAWATSANIGAYAASKGGLLAFTRSLAIELAKDDIRVNAILPGAVDTQMLRAGLDRGHLGGKGVEEKLQALGKRTPLQRVGKPEEIARPVFFLADSAQSSFITGQGLIVDGGALARLGTE